MRADFYLVNRPRFRAQPLLLVCKLAQRACAAAQPSLVLVRDLAEAEALDDLLWSFDEDAFIPHQIAGREDDEDEASVLIVPPGVDAAPRPLVINLRDTVPPGRYDRVLEVVPAEPEHRAPLRARWREYQQRGFTLEKHEL